MKDWDLVIQGGGCRAAFAAGVVDVLLEEGLYAKTAYGTSAGALIATNYAAKNIGRTQKLIERKMVNLKFLRPIQYMRGGSLMNFPLLMKEEKGIPTFNKEEFLHGGIDCYNVSTNLKDFTALYVGKKDPRFYEGLEASCTLTKFTKTPVMVGDIPCLDGGYVERIPLYKSLADEVEKIVVVVTRDKDFRFGEANRYEKNEKSVAERFSEYPAFLEGYHRNHILFDEQLDEIDRLRDSGRIFVIYPQKPLEIGIVEFNKKVLREAYNHGKEAMKAQLASLREYLSR